MYKIILLLFLLSFTVNAQDTQQIVIIKNITSCPYEITVINENGIVNYWSILEPNYQVKLTFTDSFPYHYFIMECDINCIPECSDNYKNFKDSPEHIYRHIGDNGDIIQKCIIFSFYSFYLLPPKCIRI